MKRSALILSAALALAAPRLADVAAAPSAAATTPAAPGTPAAPPVAPGSPPPTPMPSAAPAVPAPGTPLAETQGTGPIVILTLDAAIRLALATNPNLRSVEGQQRLAAARIGEARAAAGPSISASGSYTESGPIPEFTFSPGPGQPPMRIRLGSPRTRTAEVDGTYIPDISGRIRASVRSARFGARAATEVTAATINNLTQQVQSDYHSALRTQALVEVSRQAVAAAQEQLRIAQAQFRAGTVPQFDVLRASVQVANDLQIQTVAESNATIALANLVDNAAEALQTSELKEIEISTALVASRDAIEITVADSGGGVTQELKEKLFLPYFSTKKRGTGLGLAIVSRIVEEHQGSIRVEENKPVGARFVVELPLAGNAAAVPAQTPHA